MSTSAPKKLGSRALTMELKKLASEVVDTTADGTTLTREQKLAEHIWNLALGWTEKVRDDDGNLKIIKHPPVAWAAQFLFERMEGKAPQASQDETTGIKAADRVRELSRDRINAMGGSGKKQEKTNAGK